MQEAQPAGTTMPAVRWVLGRTSSAKKIRHQTKEAFFIFFQNFSSLLALRFFTTIEKEN
jgi:hypothetical protein